MASHGSPYVPPVPEYGWEEGEIFSYLIPTEDAFHAEIAEELPWLSRTGRMNYSSPSIEDALVDFEADGFTHIVVVPSAFPTPAIHTMWDVANAAVGRAVLPEEGVVMHTRPSGMNVYYSSEGIADFGPGEAAFRRGLEFVGEVGVIEALHEDDTDGGGPPYVACQPDELCAATARHERVPRAPLANNAVALPSDDSGVLRRTTGLRLLRAPADHVDVATSEFVRPRVAATRSQFRAGGLAAMRFHPPPHDALPDSVQERLVDLALRQLRLV